jgi:hypothetical protein
MRYIFILFLYITFSIKAQYQVKIKKEDNRFLFFKLGNKLDSLISKNNNLFYIKLPDNNKKNISIFVENGQFVKTSNDTIYQILFIPGMKYSHSKKDSTFNTLVEGTCSISNIIKIDFYDTNSNKSILKNQYSIKQ